MGCGGNPIPDPSQREGSDFVNEILLVNFIINSTKTYSFHRSST
jgi:hypothetical protein